MTRRPEEIEDLSAYLDGELEPAQRDQVDRLLAADPHARALLAELRATVDQVRGLPRAAAPTDLAAAVTAQLERESLLGERAAAGARRTVIFRWSRRLAVAAVLAIAGTIGWRQLPLGRDANVPHHFADADSVRDGRPDDPGKSGRDRSSSDSSWSPSAGGGAERESAKSGGGFASTGDKRADDAALALGSGTDRNRPFSDVSAGASWGGTTEAESGDAGAHRADAGDRLVQVWGRGLDGEETPHQVPASLARRQFVAAADASITERQLRSSAVSNQLLQQAPPSDVARQVLVAGDDAATEDVRRTVLAFLEGNRVPDLARQAPGQTVRGDAPFYYRQDIPTGSPEASAEGETTYVLNLPASQADQLLTVIDQAALAHHADVELRTGEQVWRFEAPGDAAPTRSGTAPMRVETRPLRARDLPSRTESSREPDANAAEARRAVQPRDRASTGSRASERPAGQTSMPVASGSAAPEIDAPAAGANVGDAGGGRDARPSDASDPWIMVAIRLQVAPRRQGEAQEQMQPAATPRGLYPTSVPHANAPTEPASQPGDAP